MRRARLWLRSRAPHRSTLKADVLAGLPCAIGGVPDGMAASVLAGVNPIHGLYAGFAGPIAGGLSASTRLMMITTTSAAALAAGSAVESVNPEDRPAALFLLTLMAGAAMIAAGLLHMGRFTRFVSHSVMVGFLSGIAVNIIARQLQDLMGAQGNGSVALGKAWDVLTNPSRIESASLLAGAVAFVILVLLSRTRIAAFSALVALAVPTVAVILAGTDVAQVKDQGDLPRGIPMPAWPQLSAFSLSLLAGALSVAAIVLVQGAGVAESAPNENGPRSDADVDFVAQGLGNLASGFFRGQPVGGSVGQTALNRTSGARTRWASIFAGLWMVLILAGLSDVIGEVVMPTLAALLIYAAARSLRLGEISAVWRTGPNSQIAIVTTFVATLLLPVALAVGLGVALSLLLQLNQSALDLRVVELVPRADGRFEERPAPARTTSHGVTLIDVYGSLRYAGARTLQHHLPDPVGSEASAVVLRMRGRTMLGATFFTVLAEYAGRLAANDGRLYVSGLDPVLIAQAQRTGTIAHGESVQLYEASPVVGESSLLAFHDATAWVKGHGPDVSST